MADGPTACGFTARSFDLLEALAAENDKAFMDAHRAAWKAKLRRPFADVLEAVGLRLADAPVPLEGSSRSMFRQARDVRFSADKRPYSEHVSGVLTPDGTKARDGPVLYLHLDARGGFLGAGYHMLSPEALGPIRDAMIARRAEWRAAMGSLAQDGLALDRENALTAMPRGYAAYADDPLAPDLKLKSLLVRRDLPKRAWIDGDVVDRAAALAHAAMPLFAFVARRG